MFKGSKLLFVTCYTARTLHFLTFWLQFSGWREGGTPEEQRERRRRSAEAAAAMEEDLQGRAEGLEEEEDELEWETTRRVHQGQHPRGSNRFVPFLFFRLIIFFYFIF